MITFWSKDEHGVTTARLLLRIVVLLLLLNTLACRTTGSSREEPVTTPLSPSPSTQAVTLVATMTTPGISQPQRLENLILDNPRGVAVAATGDIFVADSGTADNPFSGRIIHRRRDGTAGPFAVRFGAATTVLAGEALLLGLSDVAVAGDRLFVVMGAGAWLESPLYSGNRLMELSQTGVITDRFDIGGVEQQFDPDGQGIDSNAAGVAVEPTGAIWLSDAAGNWVARVTPSQTSGAYEVSSITAFPAIDDREAVPTGITVGPDGSAYVALFNCKQPGLGQGGIARVSADGNYDIVVTGLTSPIDVAFDPSGRLYILEFANDNAPQSGKLSVVELGGSVHMLVDQLNYPTSMSIDLEGRIYVAEMATPSGGSSGSGRLLMIDVATAP